MATQGAARQADLTASPEGGPGQDRERAALDEVGSRVAGTMVDLSAEAGTRLSEVAGSAGEVFRDVDRQLRGSSDQTIAVVGALSVGVAIGLLVGGSNRLLIAAALIPAALVAGIAAERMDRTTARSGQTPR